MSQLCPAGIKTSHLRCINTTNWEFFSYIRDRFVAEIRPKYGLSNIIVVKSPHFEPLVLKERSYRQGVCFMKMASDYTSLRLSQVILRRK
jgi:hypothetical protein